MKSSKKELAYRRQYYEKNRAACLARQKKYREENPDKVRAAMTHWLLTNREHKNAKRRVPNRRPFYNHEQKKAQRRLQYQQNPKFRLRKCLSARLRAAMCGFCKSARTLELLGCSLEFLRQHLESQFKPGMTWENYGLRGWHIDHKRPCASFDLTDAAQQHECFHFSNLQPLWAKENLLKNAKYAPCKV